MAVFAKQGFGDHKSNGANGVRRRGVSVGRSESESRIDAFQLGPVRHSGGDGEAHLRPTITFLRAKLRQRLNRSRSTNAGWPPAAGNERRRSTSVPSVGELPQLTEPDTSVASTAPAGRARTHPRPPPARHPPRPRPRS